jgi:glycosyltransferase involved in cell wall biosynthesis
MKVVFDLSALGSTFKTGIPRYTLALSNALLKQSVELVPGINEICLPTREFSVLTQKAVERYASNRVPRPAGLQEKVIRRIRPYIHKTLKPFVRARNKIQRAEILEFYKPSLQHIVSNSLDFDLPELPLCFTIYDLSPIAMPTVHEQANIDTFKKSLDKFANLMAKGRAVRIIAISEFTKKEIHKYLGSEFSQVTRVTPLAADDWVNVTPQISEKSNAQNTNPFILAVGTLEPRKNLVRLLEAFEIVAAGHASLKLILVGGKGWKNQKLEEALRSHPYKNRIEVLGFVSDEELLKLYKTSKVFCYPSLYEGFGLPVLEAMSVGANIVTSENSSMEEIMGPQGIYVNPLNSESIAEGIQKALSVNAVDSEAIKQRSQLFSWSKTAQATIEVYKEISRIQ